MTRNPVKACLMSRGIAILAGTGSMVTNTTRFLRWGWGWDCWSWWSTTRIVVKWLSTRVGAYAGSAVKPRAVAPSPRIWHWPIWHHMGSARKRWPWAAPPPWRVLIRPPMGPVLRGRGGLIIWWRRHFWLRSAWDVRLARWYARGICRGFLSRGGVQFLDNSENFISHGMVVTCSCPTRRRA